MHIVRAAVQCLSGVTDEYGNFLDDPEEFDPGLPGLEPVDAGLVNPHMRPPDRIWGEAPVQTRVLPMGLAGRIGMGAIRALGVDAMPVWLPVLLGADLVLGAITAVLIAWGIVW